MSDRQLFVCLARFRGRAIYFLWFTDRFGDSPDGVQLDAARRIAVWPSEEAARAAAAERGEPAEAEPATVYDLDRIDAWCARPSAETMDHAALLDAWNLFADLSTSVSTPAEKTGVFERADRTASKVYDKLFWSCNVPAVTPPGSKFEPEWSAEELQRLSAVLRSGLATFAARLPDAPPERTRG